MNCRRLHFCCHSGEISPNLVTLIGRQQDEIRLTPTPYKLRLYKVHLIEDGEYHRHVENYYEDGECNERTASYNNNNIKVANTIDMLRTLKTMKMVKGQQTTTRRWRRP